MLSAIIDFLYLHQGSLYPQLIEKSGKFAEGVWYVKSRNCQLQKQSGSLGKNYWTSQESHQWQGCANARYCKHVLIYLLRF